jgi:hypothetical protein
MSQKRDNPAADSRDAVQSQNPPKRKLPRKVVGSPGVRRELQLKSAAAHPDAKSRVERLSIKCQDDLARLRDSLSLPTNHPLSNALPIDKSVDNGPFLPSKAVFEQFVKQMRSLSKRKGANSLSGAKKAKLTP